MRAIRIKTELLKVSKESESDKKEVVKLATDCVVKLRNICYNLTPAELTTHEEGDNSKIELVDLLEGFTKQEKVIFEALLQGKTNEHIVEELFISVKTVNNYTCRIYKKVDVKDRVELIKKYGK